MCAVLDFLLVIRYNQINLHSGEDAVPRRDVYHDAVKNALIKDGWTITHDPLMLPFGGDNIYIDLGAQAPIGAEKEGRKIAVEIKTFRSPSAIADLQQALGQYMMYRYVLAQEDPERICYLALPDGAYTSLFQYADVLGMIPAENLRLIVFNLGQEIIEKWIPE